MSLQRQRDYLEVPITKRNTAEIPFDAAGLAGFVVADSDYRYWELVDVALRARSLHARVSAHSPEGIGDSVQSISMCTSACCAWTSEGIEEAHVELH